MATAPQAVREPEAPAPGSPSPTPAEDRPPPESQRPSGSAPVPGSALALGAVVAVLLLAGTVAALVFVVTRDAPEPSSDAVAVAPPASPPPRPSPSPPPALPAPRPVAPAPKPAGVPTTLPAPAPPVVPPRPEPPPAPVSAVPPFDLAGVPPERRDASARANSAGLDANRAGAFAEAIGRYEEALRLNPGNLLARYNLACALARNGEADKAIAVLRQFDVAGCEPCAQRLARARNDPDFESLRLNPKFVELVAAGEPAPAPTPSASAPVRGSIAIRAPAGITVQIDRRNVGRTPLAPVAVAKGRHRVEMRDSTGYVVVRMIDVSAASPSGQAVWSKPPGR